MKIITDYSKLVELRVKKGLYQADIARSAGVTKQAIYAIEKGKMNPTAPLAAKIAEVLGVEFDSLFTIQ